MFRTDESFLAENLDAFADERFAAILDAAGEAHVCALQPEPHWIALGSGATRLDGYAQLKPDEVQTVVFELGSATLFGTVRDLDAAAIAGARVRAGHMQRKGIRTARSEADGSYRFEGLAPGPYRLSVTLDGDPWSDADFYRQPTLEQGAALRQDFGPSPTAASLSGLLLDRAGEPVVLPADSRPTLTLFAADSRLQFSVEVDADGRFSTALEPGTYRVQVGFERRGGSLPLLEQLEMPDRDLALDLVLPGITVRGSLTGGSDADRDSVRAHRPAELYASAFHRFSTFDGTRYAIYGLGPGAWRIGARGHALEEFTELELGEDDTQRLLDLDLR